jgi:hypothetical protein
VDGPRWVRAEHGLDTMLEVQVDGHEVTILPGGGAAVMSTVGAYEAPMDTEVGK